MINWRVRIKNKSFWVALIPAVLLVVQVFAALLGFDMQLDALQVKLLACANAVFALLTVLGIVTDPTTAGIADSDRAMTYCKPYNDDDDGGSDDNNAGGWYSNGGRKGG